MFVNDSLFSFGAHQQPSLLSILIFFCHSLFSPLVRLYFTLLPLLIRKRQSQKAEQLLLLSLGVFFRTRLPEIGMCGREDTTTHTRTLPPQIAGMAKRGKGRGWGRSWGRVTPKYVARWQCWNLLLHKHLHLTFLYGFTMFFSGFKFTCAVFFTYKRTTHTHTPRRVDLQQNNKSN